MRSGNLKGLLKAAGLTAAAALGVFLFAGTSNAQYYPGYGNQYPNYGGYGNQYPGYGNNGRYDNHERKRIEKAYEKGYKDGAKQARRDVRSGGGAKTLRFWPMATVVNAIPATNARTADIFRCVTMSVKRTAGQLRKGQPGAGQNIGLQ